MSSQMVLKQREELRTIYDSFRSMSSQMVLKHLNVNATETYRFRSMSSQMVLKHYRLAYRDNWVLDLCHLKWY